MLLARLLLEGPGPPTKLLGGPVNPNPPQFHRPCPIQCKIRSTSIMIQCSINRTFTYVARRPCISSALIFRSTKYTVYGVVKISWQPVRFIGYSEKCTGYSKCLWLYFYKKENDRGSDQSKTYLVWHPPTLLVTPATLNLFDNPVSSK